MEKLSAIKRTSIVFVLRDNGGAVCGGQQCDLG